MDIPFQTQWYYFAYDITFDYFEKWFFLLCFWKVIIQKPNADELYDLHLDFD